MQNLLEDLQEILKSDERLVSDGKLLRNKVMEAGLQLDETLLKLLMTNRATRNFFFKQVGDVLVFDKIRFQTFVSNKAFLPDSYTAFKNKIGLLDGDQFVSQQKEVVLSWPFKDCVLQGGQSREDARRSEIFWNETLAPGEIDRLLHPKVLTNFKKYDRDGVCDVTSITAEDSFIIKGNNLLALHTILKRYEGAVKLIYIDPPYNTGNDSFRYNDKFNHSTWLTFMKNRLEAAKRLLRPDGALFIQVDDQEMAYLKVLCDEIFGRDNFKECIAVKNGSESGVNAINVMRGEQLFKVKEHILYYAKNSALHRFKPLYVKAVSYNEGYRLEVKKENGMYVVKDVYKEMLKKHFNQDTLRGLSNEQKHLFYASFQEYCLQHHAHIYALKTDIQKSGDAFKAFAAANKRKGIVEEYQTADGRTTLVYKGGMLSSLRERIVEENGTLYYGTLVSDFWWDIGATPSSEGGVELKAGKKPEKLLKRILTMCTNENDIVLDFFLGSGSTAATALKMKRRFIGIEQLFYGENDSIKRLQNVLQGDLTGISKDADVAWKGGGSFIYAELQKLNETYMEACVHAQTDGALKELLDEVLVKGLISYRFDENALMRIASEFDTLDIEDKKALVRDLLDKNLLYLPLSEIDDEDYAVTELTKKLNHQFHQHVSS